MAFLSTHTERCQQLAGLKEQLINRYLELESNYQVQKQEVIEYKNKAHYWETQFSRLKTREEKLKDEVETLKAQLRKREQQLFGTKSEKTRQKPDQVLSPAKPSKNKRGQQPGKPGHGRRDYSHLPPMSG